MRQLASPGNMVKRCTSNRPAELEAARAAFAFAWAELGFILPLGGTWLYCMYVIMLARV
jgi:hypothetical protein